MDVVRKIEESESVRVILEQKEEIKKRIREVDIMEEIPLIEATTLWDFPKQSYGLIPKGDNKYPGVTPALIIYNLVWRYTEPGDLVVDPIVWKWYNNRCVQGRKKKSDRIQYSARKVRYDSK